VLLFCFMAVASALEGQSGHWIPGASPLVSGQGWITVGGSWEWADSDVRRDGVILRGVFGPTDRWAVMGSGRASADGGIEDIQTGLRWTAIKHKGLSVAPFLHSGWSRTGSDAIMGAAVHMETMMGELDGSVSVFGLRSGSEGPELARPRDAAEAFEAGWTLFPTYNQELRLGVISRREEIDLTLSMRWLGKWVLLCGDLIYWPGDLGAQAHVGLRF